MRSMQSLAAPWALGRPQGEALRRVALAPAAAWAGPARVALAAFALAGEAAPVAEEEQEPLAPLPLEGLRMWRLE